MTLRLGIIRDFRAENWPSMDLCADQLLTHLAAVPGVAAIDLELPFRRRATRLPRIGRTNAAFNLDRLLNRHHDLPQFLCRTSTRPDLFHVVDHSYAHVIHALPPGRVGVYCHDLDTFRCLLAPSAEPRPWWFRRIVRRIMTGMRAAAVVFHSTARVREQILSHDLANEVNLVHAPLGVASEFGPDSPGPVELPCRLDRPFLLHVGGNIPRKRLDVLLDVFAAVRPRAPGARLVQVGGPWPAALADQVRLLGLADDVTQLQALTRPQLAELYRRATAVLVTSEAEGFGLPVIEALACGAPVIASDIPVLREVGGDAVVYCPVAEVSAWATAVLRALADPLSAPPRARRLAHAAQFSWAAHARVIGETYRQIGRDRA